MTELRDRAPSRTGGAVAAKREPGPWLVRNDATATVIATRIGNARSFWARFRGLMGRASLAPGEGIYLPDNSIHMFFMQFPIDAVFLAAADASGRREVVAVRPALRPWTGIVLPVRGAAGVLELAAGAAAHAELRQGDVVRFETVALIDQAAAPAARGA